MGNPATDKPRVSQEWLAVCQQALDALVERTPDILAAVITTGDGFDVVSYIPNDKMSPKKLSAMTSSMLGLAEALVSEAQLSRSKDVIVEAEKGQILLLSVPNVRGGLLLNVIANQKVLIGELLWACRQCCATIGDKIGTL
jgi:predicted regulator of Ras-like GTPase activity (Roadblock/LC7/MglB family)